MSPVASWGQNQVDSKHFKKKSLFSMERKLPRDVSTNWDLCRRSRLLKIKDSTVTGEDWEHLRKDQESR